MSKTQQQQYDPDAEYDLRVAYPVKRGSFKYLPRDRVIAKGRVLNRLIEENGADVIRSAEPR